MGDHTFKGTVGQLHDQLVLQTAWAAAIRTHGIPHASQPDERAVGAHSSLSLLRPPSRSPRIVRVRLSVDHSWKTANGRVTSSSLLPAGLSVDELRSSRRAFFATRNLSPDAPVGPGQSCCAVRYTHVPPTHPTSLSPSQTPGIASPSSRSVANNRRARTQCAADVTVSPQFWRPPRPLPAARTRSAPAPSVPIPCDP